MACGVDNALSGKIGDFKRAAATAVAGYVAVFGVLAMYYEQVDWWMAIVSGAGALAGLICSLMSTGKQNGRAA